MGCDIHCYIEHSRTPLEDRDRYWASFGGHNNPGRDYSLFGLLAGVRGDAKLFAARGLPPGVGYAARGDNEFYVSDELGGERTATRAQAESWVARGVSEWTDERKAWVTDPDAHSHSWLTLDEWKQALKAADDLDPKYPVGIDYRAMTAAMQVFADAGEDVRVVFWFDN